MMSSSFTGFANFIHMGGYAVYVWPVYCITLVILVGQVIQALRSAKSRLRK